MSTLRLSSLLALLGACAPTAPVDDSGRGPAGDGADGTGGASGLATTAVLATVSEDYAVGALATVDLETGGVTDEIVDLSGDPVVVVSGGLVFQLNRYSYDTVRVYTPGDWSRPLTEFALADLADPHDVEVCAGKAFLTQYGRSEVLVFDPTTGVRTGSVDLSAYDDGDGSPEASHMVQADNGRLYVAHQNLDRTNSWISVGGGVVEIDCATEAVTDTWAFSSPELYPHPPDERLVVVSEAEVGLHLLDTATGDTTLVLALDTVGASIVGYAAHEAGAVVSTTDEAYGYGIGCIDLSDWSYTAAEQVDNYLPAVAGNDRGEAWFSARTHWSNPAADNGALVYDIDGCSRETTAGPVSTVLAPFSIAFY